MIEYKFYNLEEFNNSSEDIKWDIYSDLVNEFKRKVRMNRIILSSIFLNSSFILLSSIGNFLIL